jgi:DNA-binding CsgD family transcriptional regulator
VALANARPHRRERVQAEERRIANLTDAERRVADLVAQGLSNRRVANRVFLSPHTVALHLRLIFWKLGVTSRVQLAHGRRAGQLDWRRKHAVVRKQYVDMR